MPSQPHLSARKDASNSPGVGATLMRAFEMFGTAIAIEDCSGERPPLSYAQLGEQAAALASGLHEHGGERGDRLVVVLPNSRESLIVDTAAFTAGFVRVAVSTRLHPLEIAEIISHCDPKFIFTDEGHAWDLIRLDASLRTRLIVCGGGQVPNQAIAYEHVQATQGRRKWDPPQADELAALLYTSGTTGAPKGAMLSHAAWAAMMRNSMVELPPIDENDCVLHVAPLSHFSGYVAPTYLARGARHLISPRFSPREALQSMCEAGVTTLPLVPTMLNDLILAAEETEFKCPENLRTILYGGSAIAPDRLRRGAGLFGDVFIQFYGLSELPMPLTALSARDHARWQDEEPPSRLRSAGRPNPFVNLKLVSETGDTVKEGDIGEIVVQCDTMMSGYWNDPVATKEMFAEDGWARTGDLGYISEGGYVTIVDRKKDVIVSGGYNVYPLEVENAIATLEGVKEVAVIAVPDERLVEAVGACVVVRQGFDVTATEVTEACLARLARYKRPRHIFFIDELPRTGSGKLLRRTLRDQFGGTSQPTLRVDSSRMVSR